MRERQYEKRYLDGTVDMGTESATRTYRVGHVKIPARDDANRGKYFEVVEVTEHKTIYQEIPQPE